VYKKTNGWKCLEFYEFKKWKHAPSGENKKTTLAVIKRLISWLPKEHRAEFKEWEDKE
jgi:hypothetical protein